MKIRVASCFLHTHYTDLKTSLPGWGSASKKKCLNVGMSLLGLGMGSPLVATASNTAGKAI